MFAIVVRSSHSYSNLETQRRRGFRKKTSGSGRFTSEGIQQQMFSPPSIVHSLIHLPLFVRVAVSGGYFVDSQSDVSPYNSRISHVRVGVRVDGERWVIHDLLF